MFDNLSDKLNLVFKKVRGHGKLSEKNIQDALKEVRLALLEADVNYKVVKDLINNIRNRAVGKEVLDSLTPGQQVIKIVNEELAELMGGSIQELQLTGRTPFVIMLVGLQGSGKTTTCPARTLRLLSRLPSVEIASSCPIQQKSARQHSRPRHDAIVTIMAFSDG